MKMKVRRKERKRRREEGELSEYGEEGICREERGREE